MWEGLTVEEREWLAAAVESSVVEQRRLWREATEHALEEARAAGVEIIEPDKTLFRDAVRPMLESYRGTSVYELIQAIEEIR